MTVGSMGAELFHSDGRRHGQTVTKKLIVEFDINVTVRRDNLPYNKTN
jgi:hypothetical protein